MNVARATFVCSQSREIEMPAGPAQPAETAAACEIRRNGDDAEMRSRKQADDSAPRRGASARRTVKAALVSPMIGHNVNRVRDAAQSPFYRDQHSATVAHFSP
jgi:hypothetical protein